MAQLNRLGWAIALISCFITNSCKTETAPPAAPVEEDLLTAAIEVQGGLEVLKAASAFSATYTGDVQGEEIKGTLRHKAGASRLAYKLPSEDYTVVKVTAESQCWQQIDKVVIPCPKAMASHTTRLSRLLEAAWLWPLKARSDRKVKPAGTIELAGKSFDGLVVLDGEGTEIGTLVMDRASSRAVGLVMQTTLGGKTGTFTGRFDGFEKNCGVEMPLQREYTFDGQAFARETLDGVICEAVPDTEFAPPEQIKHGTMDLKHTANVNLVCKTMKGPLKALGATLDEVLAFVQEKKLPIEGPAMLVHRKGPPAMRKPEQYVTEVCLPVDNKAWVLPEATWKGAFTLFERTGDEFLRVFGVGDYEKNTPELAGLLLKEAKKMKRSQVGAMVQVIFMPPGVYAVEQQVSEMHLPMD